MQTITTIGLDIIQGTRRTCGVNEIMLDNRRDVKVGRANST